MTRNTKQPKEPTWVRSPTQIPHFAAQQPGIPTKPKGIQYTSESRIREQVMELVALGKKKRLDLAALKAQGVDFDEPKKATVSDEEKLRIAEDIIKRVAQKTAKAHRLMTDQQLADWTLGVKFTVGAKARYVGPDRDEKTEKGLYVHRPHGQLGTIVSILPGERKDAGRLLVFRPDQAVEVEGADPHFVDLTVREGSPGWLLLERVP